jgi:hypothetical protein
LRLDAVGYAVSQLLTMANTKEVVNNQFRIGLFPFITDIDKNYLPLTTVITGSAITNAANNLAAELDTNTNATLGSGGTHIDNALHSINALISTVGTGSSVTNTLPYVFLVTDGAQDNQYKDVPNGNWHASNHATLFKTARRRPMRGAATTTRRVHHKKSRILCKPCSTIRSSPPTSPIEAG